MHNVVASAEPWYLNGTAWTVFGAVLGIVAIVISIILWQFGMPRQILEYSIPAATAMLNRETAMRSLQPKILLGGLPVSDPWVVRLQITNRGRRDIKTDDFDQARPINFDLQAKILTILNGGDIGDLPIRIDNHNVAIGPALIRSGQRFEIDFLVDGSPGLSCDAKYLVDIKVRRKAEYYGDRVPYARKSISLQSIIPRLIISLLVYAFAIVPFIISSKASLISNIVISAFFWIAAIVWISRKARPYIYYYQSPWNRYQ